MRSRGMSPMVRIARHSSSMMVRPAAVSMTRICWGVGVGAVGVPAAVVGGLAAVAMLVGAAVVGAAKVAMVVGAVGMVAAVAMVVGEAGGLAAVAMVVGAAVVGAARVAMARVAVAATASSVTARRLAVLVMVVVLLGVWGGRGGSSRQYMGMGTRGGGVAVAEAGWHAVGAVPTGASIVFGAGR